MCFSLGAVESLLIWLVVVCAVVAIIRLVVPSLLPQIAPAGTVILNVINIIMWVVILIFVIYVVFDLLACIVPLPAHPLR
jgi:hypothetical protein